MKSIFMMFLFCGSFLFTQMAVNPLLEEQLITIRDPNTNRKEFRRAVQKIGEYLGMEIAKDLPVKKVQIETVLKQSATHYVVNENVVLVTILRAGIPLFMGLSKAFPDAEVGFFAMKRNEQTLKAKTDYIALPPLKNKVVILCDPMIATGGSAIDAIAVIDQMHPKKIILAGAIAAKPGLERIAKEYPNVKVYPAAVDEILNEKGYIVPGLGDAGDRAYGIKLD